MIDKCIYQQEETDCGPACLAMIFLHYHKRVPLSAIRNSAGTDLQGTNAIGLTKAAETYGFKAATVKGNVETLIKSGAFPCIADVLIEGKSDHYVVINKATKRRITVTDPAIGKVNLSLDEFCGKKVKKSLGIRYKWKGHLILVAPGDGFVKDKAFSFKKPGLIKELLKTKKQAWPLAAVSLMTAAINVAFLCFFKAGNEKTEGNFYGLVYIAAFFFIFEKLLSLVKKRLKEVFLSGTDKNAVQGTYEKMLNLPLSFFEVRSKGDTVMRLSDGFKLGEGLAQMISLFFCNLPVILAGFVMIAAKNIRVAILAAAIWSVVLFGMLFTEERNKRRKLLAARESSIVNSYIYETLEGISDIKLYGMKEKSVKEMGNKLTEFLRRELGLNRHKEIQGEIWNLIRIGGGALFLYVVCLFFDIDTEWANVLWLTAAYGISSSAMAEAGRGIELIKSAMLALERIEDISESAPENAGKRNAEETINKKDAVCLELKDVSFKYGMRKTLFKHLNLKVYKGESVAIVGENGSGKTTLVKLITGLYMPTEGRVFFDGTDVRKTDLDHMRERIGYVSQTPYLFYGSVYDNIVMGKTDIPDEYVIKAACCAGCHDFIMGLPNGYQTILGENAVNLSGGQKQKLAIARALVLNPELILIDEGTSQLDESGTEIFSSILGKDLCNSTKIVITHDPLLAQKCDRVVQLSKEGLSEKEGINCKYEGA